VEQTDPRPFGSDPYFATGATIGGNGAIVPESLRLTANILRVGLNYRFGY
jgi:hypothetical protein